MVPEGWLSRGDAFVRGERAQLAVFGGIPGERARVRMISQGGHQDRARFIQPVGPASPYRVEPPCDRFVPCGRCPLMHLNEAGQERARIEGLRSAFSEASLNGPIAPLVKVPGELHAYDLLAGWSDERHPRLGVPGKDGRRVVPVPHCVVTTQSIRSLMSTTAYHVQELKIWPWENGRGNLRGVLARQSATTGELVVTFIFGKPTPFATTLAEAVAGQLSAVAGGFAHWNDQPGPMLARDPDTGDAEATLVYGRTFIEEDLDGLRFRIGALDSWPDYPHAAAALGAAIVEGLAPAQGDAVLDLGSGIGARTLRLARRSGWALGIEGAEVLVRRARDNATRNGVTAEFASGPYEEVLTTNQSRLAGRRPLIVADPGSKGLDAPTLDALVALDPRRVALVSNNPRALARDTARMVARGLQIERVVPFDTAPNTMFGDTLVMLRSRDTTAPTVRAPRRKTIRA